MVLPFGLLRRFAGFPPVPPDSTRFGDGEPPEADVAPAGWGLTIFFVLCTEQGFLHQLFQSGLRPL